MGGGEGQSKSRNTASALRKVEFHRRWADVGRNHSMEGNTSTSWE